MSTEGPADFCAERFVGLRRLNEAESCDGAVIKDEALFGKEEAVVGLQAFYLAAGETLPGSERADGLRDRIKRAFDEEEVRVLIGDGSEDGEAHVLPLAGREQMATPGHHAVQQVVETETPALCRRVLSITSFGSVAAYARDCSKGAWIR